MNLPIISLIYFVLCILLLKFPQLTGLKVAADADENGRTEKSKAPISFKSGWKCENCGSKNNNSDKFCTACGTANTNESNTVNSVASNIAKNTADKIKSTVSGIPRPDINNAVEKLKTTASKLPIPNPRNKDENDFEKLKQLKSFLIWEYLLRKNLNKRKKKFLKCNSKLRRIKP